MENLYSKSPQSASDPDIQGNPKCALALVARARALRMVLFLWAVSFSVTVKQSDLAKNWV
jgi:hypothetical protein